jgi:FkbM family methyltransferase
MYRINSILYLDISKKINYLHHNRFLHSSSTKIFNKVKNKFEKEIIKNTYYRELFIKFSDNFRKIKLKYFKMGKLNSTHLLGFNELIIFVFYLFNKKKYKKFIDIGGNIGLHSIIFDRLKIKVQAFEPDPLNYEEFKNNIALNKCKGIKLNNTAISCEAGLKNFVRICDNTTGNHIEGKKKQLYGKLEIFKVKSEKVNKYLVKKSLVKIDAEGSELDILNSIKKFFFKYVDFILEINNAHNAKKIFELSKKYKFNIFSQKILWNLAKSYNDLPNHHREGSIFITSDKLIDW